MRKDLHVAGWLPVAVVFAFVCAALYGLAGLNRELRAREADLGKVNAHRTAVCARHGLAPVVEFDGERELVTGCAPR